MRVLHAPRLLARRAKRPAPAHAARAHAPPAFVARAPLTTACARLVTPAVHDVPAHLADARGLRAGDGAPVGHASIVRQALLAPRGVPHANGSSLPASLRLGADRQATTARPGRRARVNRRFRRSAGSSSPAVPYPQPIHRLTYDQVVGTQGPVGVAMNPMRELYRRLETAGISRTFVKKSALPSWWSDSLATSPDALAEAAIVLARRLGVDPNSIVSDAGPVTFRPLPNVKFKAAKGSTRGESENAARVAVQLAKLVLQGSPELTAKRVPSAADLRSLLLERAPCVNFKTLLNWCWSVGIPVLHVRSFPSAKKMDGLAVRVNGRPVIVLASNKRASAWLLFVLAHEIGHIASGHLDSDGVLVDDQIDRESSDAQEAEANQYAATLLSGKTRFSVFAPGRWPNAITLAADAKRIGAEKSIDPGYVVLNYAHTMRHAGTFWATANVALKRIEPDANAPGLIRSTLEGHLKWAALSDDEVEYTRRLAGTADDADEP